MMTAEELDNQYRQLLALVHVQIQDQQLSYLEMLTNLKEDRLLLLGLRRAPAAKRNHHAYEGGLIKHLLEMWTIWTLNKDFLLKDAHPDAKDYYLTDERVLKAIIHHDIEKAYETYELDIEDSFSVESQRDRSGWSVRYADLPERKMMAGDLRSWWVLQKHNIKLDPEMVNVLFWAHGGFSELQNEACTTLAKLVYLLDEMSGNVKDQLRKGDFLRMDVIHRNGTAK